MMVTLMRGAAVLTRGRPARMQRERGGSRQFPIGAHGSRGMDKHRLGAGWVELQRKAEEGIGAAVHEALAHEPSVGRVSGQVEPALEGERGAGGEVGGGGGAERCGADGGDVSLRGRGERTLGAKGGKERSES